MPTWTLWKVAFRLALILMTLTLFLCRTVESAEDMTSVPFGLPVPFIVLDARQGAPAAYPTRLCFGDPRRRPTRLRPLAALVDLLLLTVACAALLRGLPLARASWRARRTGRR